MIDPVEYNFKVYVGQTLDLGFFIWEDSNRTVPYDLTGHAVKAEARQAYNSLLFVNLNPTITSNAVYLNATPEQLARFEVLSKSTQSKFVYDIEITKPDGKIWTMVRGIIEVNPEVTKS
jgi:hypothetical protein